METNKTSVFRDVTTKFIASIDIPEHLFEPSFLLDLPYGIHRHIIPDPGTSEVDDWFISQGAVPGDIIYIEVDD